MTIRIFNPEHDIALAHNKKQFTAPHAGRQLHADLDFLPALYSDDGDIVIVGNVERAQRAYEHILGMLSLPRHNVQFVATDDKCALRSLLHQSGQDKVSFQPWGIDAAIVGDMQRMGFTTEYDDSQLDAIRRISSRQWCAAHLQTDVDFVTDASHAMAMISERQRCVIKSPWSSTGRGVRYIEMGDNASATYIQQVERWVHNVISQQQGIVIEPFYNKVLDFGLEYMVHAGGRVEYVGLSLFHTVKGAYTGNILASEHDKQQLLARYLPVDEQLKVSQNLGQKLENTLAGEYKGPLGIDCMMVSDGDNLHVAIAELNLRNTMGHVALALSPQNSQPSRLMRIEYDGSHYHLRINDSALFVEKE